MSEIREYLDSLDEMSVLEGTMTGTASMACIHSGSILFAVEAVENTRLVAWRH